MSEGPSVAIGVKLTEAAQIAFIEVSAVSYTHLTLPTIYSV